MNHAISITTPGGPEVLQWTSLPVPVPGPGHLLVAVEAAGVNYIDVYRRNGLYPVSLPSIPGLELAGRVIAVGDEVTGFAPGDRVASADAEGAYAEQALVPADRAVPVPDEIDSEVAAAVLLQGMTADYLVRDTFALRAGHRVLLHAAAGGVGQLLVQLAKSLGAEVFATVGSPAKAEVARQAGADHVIVTSEEDLVTAVERLAGPRPIDVVYDGVGRDTFAAGLALLRPRGTMVTFGNASGPVDPISPLTLGAQGSLYLTRPSLSHYTATPQELRQRAAQVFQEITEGRLAVAIGARFPLAQAAEAHRLLEGRRTTGKVILLP